MPCYSARKPGTTLSDLRRCEGPNSQASITWAMREHFNCVMHDRRMPPTCAGRHPTASRVVQNATAVPVFAFGTAFRFCQFRQNLNCSNQCQHVSMTANQHRFRDFHPVMGSFEYRLRLWNIPRWYRSYPQRQQYGRRFQCAPQHSPRKRPH